MNYMKKVSDLQLLAVACERVKQNNGCAGDDEVTISQFVAEQQQYLAVLTKELTQGSYRSGRLKQVALYLQGKPPRPLVVPNVRDRVVHTAVALVIQPILEQHFADSSWGYRPGRSYLDAVAEITKYREQGYSWLVDADIKTFFDNICQKTLLKLLLELIPDQPLVDFVKCCLFDRQVENKQLIFGSKVGFGIPQGSPLSPMLANLYLDQFDKNCLAAKLAIVRYADDFVIMVRSKKEAEFAWAVVNKNLTMRHLMLNKEKSQIVNFEQGFSFLGHSFIGDLVIDNKEQQLADSQITPLVAEALAAPEVDMGLESAMANKHFSQLNEALLAMSAHNIEDSKKLKLIQPCKLKTLYLTQAGCVVNLVGHRLIISKSREKLGQVPLAILELIVIMTRCQL